MRSRSNPCFATYRSLSPLHAFSRPPPSMHALVGPVLLCSRQRLPLIYIPGCYATSSSEHLLAVFRTHRCARYRTIGITSHFPIPRSSHDHYRTRHRFKVNGRGKESFASQNGLEFSSNKHPTLAGKGNLMTSATFCSRAPICLVKYHTASEKLTSKNFCAGRT